LVGLPFEQQQRAPAFPSVSLSLNVYCVHATTLGLFVCPAGTTLAPSSSVELLAKAVDWYFIIAAPTVLAVIALRGTGLARW
jgi:hypothetical protein